MSNKLAVVGSVLYLLFGLYLINASFVFVPMPNFIESIDSWIVLIAGILVILGGVNYFRANKNPY
ncbi:MAG: hypothetical protein WDZ69_02805 [Candidatus Pacearchaeota archaeon]